ncbi:UbiA family prenyltransferase [Natronomonas sp. F2-12]|jgi:lycopene cyclase domain-containing protein|uniref:UbiA family prenyltransferase n=1 Tax=Natronomonas aquatica TaxID=2841590 RepID=A0A9R1CS21_9EURY|nr:UbiA family prenyltransferase [Natronomonas aquatica]
MALARHGSGLRRDLRALLSQVHPVFMLPPLAATWFGAAVAGEFSIEIGAIHTAAIFFAVYTAHVKDGYVDFYRRGEDDDHPMTARGCRLALVVAGVGFASCTAALGFAVGPGAALVTLPTWFIGYLHAPQLDTNPLTTTLGYPTGIALAILGGFYVQTTVVTATILGFALVFLVTLAGVKIVDDEQDYEYDRSIDKRTVSVLLGPDLGRALARYLLFVGLIGVLWGTVSGLFPPFTSVGALAFGAVALVAVRAPSTLSTMLLIRGAYVFLAVLFVAVWFRPLAGSSLPDITVFGPYTYLLTEFLFGTIALVLLRYAGAFRSAARTIAALYPIAYLWDWYTLEVGVFEIPMRTGYDLVGIPIEEHVFMIVVPALVIGIHETIGKLSPGPVDDAS